MAGGFLVNGDGGGEALDVIHIGLVHLADELARVGRERLDVAALALGEDGIEGQRGFARPESPVMTTSLSRGISTVMFFRLWTRAPTTRMTLEDME